MKIRYFSAFIPPLILVLNYTETLAEDASKSIYVPTQEETERYLRSPSRSVVVAVELKNKVDAQNNEEVS